MIGQLLLLLLAVTVGSYNFTCGILLAVLFLSIMLQSKTKSDRHEGFVDYEEGDDKDMELNENFDSANAKKKVSKNTEEDMDETEMETTPTPKSTRVPKMTSKPEANTNVIDELKQEIKDSQKKIQDLESKIQEATMNSMSSNKKMNNASSMENDMDMAMQMDESTSNPELGEETEPTVEGFECGCSNDSRRTKFVKYQEAEGLIETFENQSPKKQHENDCYDLAGCKYQNGYTPFNDTLYGPPVDSCHAYRKANVNTTGTIFYPLN
jgi:hypothetical protein